MATPQPMPIQQFTQYTTESGAIQWIPWLNYTQANIPRLTCTATWQDSNSSSYGLIQFFVKSGNGKRFTEIRANWSCTGYANNSLTTPWNPTANLYDYARAPSVSYPNPASFTGPFFQDVVFIPGVSIRNLYRNAATLMQVVNIDNTYPVPHRYSYYVYDQVYPVDPPCLNYRNRTCDVVPGTLGDQTAVQMRYSFHPTLWTYTATAAYPNGEQVHNLQFVTIRNQCTVPVCQITPIDCVVSTTPGNYSACYYAGSFCIKSRVRPILVEPQGEGDACPSLEARTETVACLSIECERLSCVYATKEQTGSCIGNCGAKLVNITLVRYSIVENPACDPPTVVSYRIERCGTSMPCSLANTSAPVSPNCSIRGNAGYAGSSFDYVSIRFDANLAINGSNSTLASTFRMYHATTSRPYIVDSSKSYVTTSEIRLYVVVAADDGEGTTGDTLVVWYTPPTSSANGSLYTLTQDVFPVFSCQTTDLSGPQVVFASFEKLNSLSPPIPVALLMFSEPGMRSCSGSPVTTDYLTFFGATRMTNTSTFEFELFPEDTTQWYTASLPMTYSDPTNIYLQFNRSLFCDARGNAMGNYSQLIQLNYQPNITSVMPPFLKGSTKIYLSSNPRSVSSILVTSVFPNQKSLLEAEFQSFLLTQFSGNDTGSIPFINPSGIVFDGHASEGAYVSKFSLLWPQNEVGDNATFALTYLGEESVTTMPFGMSALTYYLDGNVQYAVSPYIVSAVAAPGSFFLRVRFSKLRLNGVAFGVGDILYSGTNIVQGYFDSEDNGLVVVLNMRFPYDYAMLSSDSVTFYDVYARGNPFMNTVFVNNSLGARPTVIAAVLSKTSSFFQPDTLTVVYSDTIDSFGVDNILADSVKFNWTQPFVSRISAVDYRVSGRQITYTIAIQCTMTPCPESVSQFNVSARGMFDAAGNLAASFENQPVVDDDKPILIEAVEVEEGTFVITVSKEVTVLGSEFAANLVPPAESCEPIPSSVVLCSFNSSSLSDGGCSGSASVTVGAGSYQDLATNLGTYSEKYTECSSGSCSCGLGDLDLANLLFAIFALVTFPLTIIGGSIAIVYYLIWPKFCAKSATVSE